MVNMMQFVDIAQEGNDKLAISTCIDFLFNLRSSIP